MNENNNITIWWDTEFWTEFWFGFFLALILGGLITRVIILKKQTKKLNERVARLELFSTMGMDIDTMLAKRMNDVEEISSVNNDRVNHLEYVFGDMTKEDEANAKQPGSAEDADGLTKVPPGLGLVFHHVHIGEESEGDSCERDTEKIESD